MRRLLPFAPISCLMLIGVWSLSKAPGAPVIGHPASPRAAQIRQLARDAYYYAFPIVLMDITRQQMTNVPNAAAVPGRAPVNQFAHFRTYPDANAREVVRFNFDTLYYAAWLDLSKGPMILSVPDTLGRYYLIPALDMWTDVFSTVGSRTTGDKAGDFAFVPPGWRGSLPRGVQRIEAPTSMIWLLGRVQTDGSSDYENVHRIQDGMKLTPLSEWGKAAGRSAESHVDASVDPHTPPLTQATKLTGVELLTRLAALMQKYPPHPNDYPILFRLRTIGLEAGKPWNGSTLDRTAIDAINAGAKDALADMKTGISTIGSRVNGWSLLTDNVGTYGTSYRQRAIVAMGGLGANLPADAIYPTAFADKDGDELEGGNRYRLHFDKGALPPANAFWSITMYDGDGFQIPNPINRFAIGDRDPLQFNADGSLDLYIQPDSPGADKESNWLPSPKSGAIAPTMRIYSPRDEVMDGTWTPPAIQQGK